MSEMAEVDGLGVEPVPNIGFNGCDWPLDVSCGSDEWDSYADDVQERSKALAGATLRRLTGYRVGGCPVTVRPCKAGCSGGLLPVYPGSGWRPSLNESGYWVNSCGCFTGCSCTLLCEVSLPAPIGAVYEVKVDGEIVDEGDYAVYGDRITWVGSGNCPWPTCQDMSKPDTEEGTFSIRYLNGYPVDGLGAYAGGVLALEFARACAGNACRLPPGVTTVVRQGIAMEVVSGAFPEGFTGLREVDTYLALWNPTGLQRQATVWTPNQVTPRHQTI